MEQTPEVEFGSPELWPKVYSSLRPQFDAIKALESLISEMLEAGEDKNGTKAQILIRLFARTTARSLNDLLVLVGNGCGLGGLIIARGMFEYAVMAEYIRLHPREVHDYIAALAVSQYERYVRLKHDSPEKAAKVDKQSVAGLRQRYVRGAARLRSRNGNIRRQWHRKSLRQMAEEVGRLAQYETPYSIAASVHHGAPEGVAAHIERDGDMLTFGEPSLHWVDTALVSGHIHVIEVFETLNKAMRLGFKQRLADAVAAYRDVWTRDTQYWGGADRHQRTARTASPRFSRSTFCTHDS